MSRYSAPDPHLQENHYVDNEGIGMQGHGLNDSKRTLALKSPSSSVSDPLSDLSAGASASDTSYSTKTPYTDEVQLNASIYASQQSLNLFNATASQWSANVGCDPTIPTSFDWTSLAPTSTNLPVDVTYGPAPLPIDSFASQEPYPYALERLCSMPPWMDPHTISASQAPYVLFPSSAHNFSSAEALTAEAVLPVAYYQMPQAPVSSASAALSQVEGRPAKRPRPSFSPGSSSVTTLLNSPDPRLLPPNAKRQKPADQPRTRVKEDPEALHQPYGLTNAIPFAVPEHTGAPVIALRAKAESHLGLKSIDSRRRAVRSGPLTNVQKEKIEAVRYVGACWRCRRYKKPCNAGAAICNHCLTSGLRLWPGSIGCRKGDFKVFAISVLPEGAEDTLKNLVPLNYPKPNNWRRPKAPPERLPPPRERRTDDKWEGLYIKMTCLHIFGLEVIELLEIAEKLSKSGKQHANLMESVATALSYSSDYYFSFVNTITPQPQPDLIHTTTMLRAMNVKAWNLVLSTCLTGKLQNWPTAFIGACVVVCSLVIFTDTMVVMPPTARQHMWPDAYGMIANLRDHLYASVQEMLIVLAKGAKPLKFKCWGWLDPAEGKENSVKVRNPEGMRLMNGDRAAFDAMASLQAWTTKYRHLLENDEWFSTKPFNPTVFPISSVSRFVIRSGGAFSSE